MGTFAKDHGKGIMRQETGFEIQTDGMSRLLGETSKIATAEVVGRRRGSIPMIHAAFPALPVSSFHPEGTPESILVAVTTHLTETFSIILNTSAPPPVSYGQELDMALVAATVQDGHVVETENEENETWHPGAYSCDGHPPAAHMVLTTCSKITNSTDLVDIPIKIVNATLREAHGPNDKKLAAEQVSRVIRGASKTVFIVDHKIFEDVIALLGGNSGRNMVINSQQFSEGARRRLRRHFFRRFRMSIRNQVQPASMVAIPEGHGKGIMRWDGMRNPK